MPTSHEKSEGEELRNLHRITEQCWARIRTWVIWFWASLVAQTVKNLPAMWKTGLRSLCREDPLEKGIATHPSILAWRIPWTRRLTGYSPRGHKSQTWASDQHFYPYLYIDFSLGEIKCHQKCHLNCSLFNIPISRM